MELMVRGGGGGSSVFHVTVDMGLQAYSSHKISKDSAVTTIRAQELYESRGGRSGLPSLISLRFLWT